VYIHPLGATLVTVGDYYDNRVLTDWKITSVWSFMLGTKDEWINQLNVVRYIYGKNGIPVDRMQVYAILRDHMKSKIYDAGYPQIPFQRINIPALDGVEDYITTRVMAHLEAESHLGDINSVPQCSPKERWQRETTYAVKKAGNKKALRVLSTEKDAMEYIKGLGTQKDLSVETRIGKDIKCADYCSVNRFCPYFKRSDVGPSEE
jgi:hypothetical protein